MLLLIDAGNTRIKWALAQPHALPGQWIASGAVAQDALEQLPAQWGAHLAAPVQRALVSNVAGPAVQARLAAVLPAGSRYFASTATLGAMHNRYRQPQQLGCDRFAAAFGALTIEPGKALIVATCGTATTIDAVSASGDFLGGMILPGLGLMASALARNTAGLPQATPGAAPPPLFADNTNDAIVSGCLSAQAGAIERACARHRAHSCILSGGAAPFIAPVLGTAHRIVDNIVLIGLHAAANVPG
jgi:type III pantothenate kinase